MQLRLTVSRDAVTPDLKRRIMAMRDRTPILRGMGQAVVSLAKQAFKDPGVRPATWPKRKKATPTGSRDTKGRFLRGAHALLLKSGDLKKGIHVGDVTNDSVLVGSPKVYAAVHQFGSRKKSGRGAGIPPRPFFPLMGKPKSARLTPRAAAAVEASSRRELDARLT